MPTAFVTGGSRGLGRALAVRLARDVSHVFVGYRVRRDDAEAVVAEVAEQGVGASTIQIDLADAGSCRAAFDRMADRDLSPDILVNNAGINRDGWFSMMREEDFEDVVATNLIGTARCCRLAARSMVAKRAGAIVNISSVAALRASPGQANYAASKAGLQGLTATLAHELGPYGVRVNAVAAGVLDVGMAQRTRRAAREDTEARVPLRRCGRAQEVAEVVAFLASDAAAYVTGATVPVDGGLSA